MSDRTWTIGEDAAGLRLDKYLADPDRLGSRARAVGAGQAVPPPRGERRCDVLEQHLGPEPHGHAAD